MDLELTANYFVDNPERSNGYPVNYHRSYSTTERQPTLKATTPLATDDFEVSFHCLFLLCCHSSLFYDFIFGKSFFDCRKVINSTFSLLKNFRWAEIKFFVSQVLWRFQSVPPNSTFFCRISFNLCNSPT